MAVFVDSHCHLADPRLAPRLDPVLTRSRRAGVTVLFACATSPQDWDTVLDLHRRHPEVVPFLGVHPFFLDHLPPGWKQELAARVRDNPCGIGEIGLDLDSATAPPGLQEDAFAFQLGLAADLKRPVNCHCRKAWPELLRLLGSSPPKLLLHALSAPLELLPELSGRGAFFSFSGSLTWPGNRRTPRLLLASPRDRILFETDAPDIIPHTGSDRPDLNEPAFVRLVYEKAASLLGLSVDALAALVLDNARNFLAPLGLPS